MRRFHFLLVSVLGLLCSAIPAHAQGAIAREMLLASVRPEAPRILAAAPAPASTSPCATSPGSAGTPHGECLAWGAGAQGSDTNAVAGYNVYRVASSTCGASNFPASPAPINPAVVTSLFYLDATANSNGPAVSTAYCYGVATVDTVGNQSAFATLAVSTPATFPANATAPTAVTNTVQ